MTTQFKISGMTCHACAKLVSMKFEEIQGVTSTQVDQITGLAQILAERPISLLEVNQVLADTHYQISALNS